MEYFNFTNNSFLFLFICIYILYINEYKASQGHSKDGPRETGSQPTSVKKRSVSTSSVFEIPYHPSLLNFDREHVLPLSVPLNTDIVSGGGHSTFGLEKRSEKEKKKIRSKKKSELEEKEKEDVEGTAGEATGREEKYRKEAGKGKAVGKIFDGKKDKREALKLVTLNVGSTNYGSYETEMAAFIEVIKDISMFKNVESLALDTFYSQIMSTDVTCLMEKYVSLFIRETANVRQMLENKLPKLNDKEKQMLETQFLLYKTITWNYNATDVVKKADGISQTMRWISGEKIDFHISIEQMRILVNTFERLKSGILEMDKKITTFKIVYDLYKKSPRAVIVRPVILFPEEIKMFVFKDLYASLRDFLLIVKTTFSNKNATVAHAPVNNIKKKLRITLRYIQNELTKIAHKVEQYLSDGNVDRESMVSELILHFFQIFYSFEKNSKKTSKDSFQRLGELHTLHELIKYFGSGKRLIQEEYFKLIPSVLKDVKKRENLNELLLEKPPSSELTNVASLYLEIFSLECLREKVTNYLLLFDQSVKIVTRMLNGESVRCYKITLESYIRNHSVFEQLTSSLKMGYASILFEEEINRQLKNSQLLHSCVRQLQYHLGTFNAICRNIEGRGSTLKKGSAEYMDHINAIFLHMWNAIHVIKMCIKHVFF